MGEEENPTFKSRSDLVAGDESKEEKAGTIVLLVSFLLSVQRYLLLLLNE